MFDVADEAAINSSTGTKSEVFLMPSAVYRVRTRRCESILGCVYNTSTQILLPSLDTVKNTDPSNSGDFSCRTAHLISEVIEKR